MSATEMTVTASSIPQMKGAARTVALNKVFPNTWNPNEMSEGTYTKVKNSLSKFEFSQPLIVREIPEGYELIDGEHRLRAAEELGMTEVTVWNLGVVSDSVAKQLTINMNELKGSPDIDELSKLIADLEADIGREEIILNLPYTAEQIDNMLTTIEFDWNSFEAETEQQTEARDRDVVRIHFTCTRSQAESIMDTVEGVMRELDLEYTDEQKAVALQYITEAYLGYAGEKKSYDLGG